MLGKRDFSKAVVKSLKNQGYEFFGTTCFKVVYENGSFGYDTAYKLVKGGCQYIREYSQVIKLANVL